MRFHALAVLLFAAVATRERRRPGDNRRNATQATGCPEESRTEVKSVGRPSYQWHNVRRSTEVIIMSVSAERQRGKGKLRNCIFPGSYFTVEYSLMQTRVVPSPNRLLAADLGNIEYIRVLDGTTMPNGKYTLELAADQASEIVGVRKRLDNWELLPG
jgi:hypothetical protein